MLKNSLILLLLLPALCLGANDITSWVDLAAINDNAATLDANYVLIVDLDKNSGSYATYVSQANLKSVIDINTTPTAGDGSNKEFQVTDSLPVDNVNSIITVYKDSNSVDEADYSTNLDTGIITFDIAPGAGEVISADFNYFEGFEQIEPFTGTFDGQGHTISDLYINRPSNSYYIGLFGKIEGAEVSNLGLVNCSISGDTNVGILIGGILSSSTVSNSYNTGSVSGNINVGGLVGYDDSSTVSNSYSTGSVSGNNRVGGLVGNSDSSTVSNSFWDTETSGQATSDGGTGKTTKEMQDPYTFYDAGWDFDDVWYWNDPMGNRARLTAPFSNKTRGRRRGGQGGYMKLRK